MRIAMHRNKPRHRHRHMHRCKYKCTLISLLSSHSCAHECNGMIWWSGLAVSKSSVNSMTVLRPSLSVPGIDYRYANSILHYFHHKHPHVCTLIYTCLIFASIPSSIASHEDGEYRAGVYWQGTTNDTAILVHNLIWRLHRAAHLHEPLEHKCNLM